MKPGAGKAKGNAFERDVCKSLSLWITAGKRDDVLWRGAISGGRATVAAKKGKQLAHVSGDICAVHPDGFRFVSEFYIECKAYRDLSIPRLVTQQAGTLVEFWKITRLQAKAHKKLPMLIWKQNQHQVMVVVDDEGFNRLRLQLANIIIPALCMNVLSFKRLLRISYDNHEQRRARPRLQA